MRPRLRKHTINKLSALLSFAVLLGSPARPSAATHNCKLVPDSIRIDGVLDEPVWKQLDTLTMTRNNGPTGGTPGVATKILMAWSKTNLYLAILAETKNVKGLVTEHDGAIYDEDALELFLDPDGDGKTYLELEWNCLNTSLDVTYASPRNGADWAWAPAGVRNAVKVHGTANKGSDTDTNWVVEVSLPWSAVQPFSKAALPPKIGDKLPLNLYRIDHSSGSEELLAWTPTGVADFHRPDKFGSLVFSEGPAAGLSAPFRSPLLRTRARRQARSGFPRTGGPGDRFVKFFDASGRKSPATLEPAPALAPAAVPVPAAR